MASLAEPTTLKLPVGERGEALYLAVADDARQRMARSLEVWTDNPNDPNRRRLLAAVKTLEVADRIVRRFERQKRHERRQAERHQYLEVQRTRAKP